MWEGVCEVGTDRSQVMGEAGGAFQALVRAETSVRTSLGPGNSRGSAELSKLQILDRSRGMAGDGSGQAGGSRIRWGL